MSYLEFCALYVVLHLAYNYCTEGRCWSEMEAKN